MLHNGLQAYWSAQMTHGISMLKNIFLLDTKP